MDSEDVSRLIRERKLRNLREVVNGVESALTDQDNHGAGTHLHYISDWLEKISKR
jgi:hypothetical protein